MIKFWKILLTLLFLPKAIIYHIAVFLISSEKAKPFFYDLTVKISSKVLSLNIPELKTGEEFKNFQDNFKAALFKMPFEEIEVDKESETLLKLKITRCQFVEVYRLLRMPELVKALCEGDERFVDRYQPRICFKRDYTIEKGDGFCDHTFILNKS